MFKLRIENDEELLKQYGLAVALYSSTDYLLGEFIRLKGGLLKGANQDVVNKLLDNKTFGWKIEIAKSIIDDNELKEALLEGLDDRNLLAHGVSAEQEGRNVLLHKKDFHDLTVEQLIGMVTKARKLASRIIDEIQKGYRLISPDENV